MSASPLSIGVLGLDRQGQQLLEAVSEIDSFRIGAVADKDNQLLETVSERYACQAFDDVRQFIVQNAFDCLFIATPLHRCLEPVRTAIKEGCHCLKLAPMARDFEEAHELFRLTQNRGVRFDVVNPSRYVCSFQTLHRQVQERVIERPFLIRLFGDVGLIAGEDPQVYQLHPDSQNNWVTDQELAGGGVLLHNCYQLIDQLICCFGLPQQVYALCNSQASAQQQLHHLTEDTVLVSMQFNESLIAELVALRHWDDRPAQESITVYDRQRIVAASLDEFTSRHTNGYLEQQDSFACDQLALLKTLLQDYARSFTQPKECFFTSDSQSNLRVMAVMQAAYLSVRTGSPEEPERILSIASL